MDKFRVCILMVEVALDKAMDGFVCDSFPGREAGKFDSIPGIKRACFSAGGKKRGTAYLNNSLSLKWKLRSSMDRSGFSGLV